MYRIPYITTKCLCVHAWIFRNSEFYQRGKHRHRHRHTGTDGHLADIHTYLRTSYVWPPSEVPKTTISTFCHMILNFMKGVVEINQNWLNISQNGTKGCLIQITERIFWIQIKINDVTNSSLTKTFWWIVCHTDL